MPTTPSQPSQPAVDDHRLDSILYTYIFLFRNHTYAHIFSFILEDAKQRFSSAQLQNTHERLIRDSIIERGGRNARALLFHETPNVELLLEFTKDPLCETVLAAVAKGPSPLSRDGNTYASCASYLASFVLLALIRGDRATAEQISSRLNDKKNRDRPYSYIGEDPSSIAPHQLIDHTFIIMMDVDHLPKLLKLLDTTTLTEFFPLSAFIAITKGTDWPVCPVSLDHASQQTLNQLMPSYLAVCFWKGDIQAIGDIMKTQPDFAPPAQALIRLAMGQWKEADTLFCNYINSQGSLDRSTFTRLAPLLFTALLPIVILHAPKSRFNLWHDLLRRLCTTPHVTHLQTAEHILSDFRSIFYAPENRNDSRDLLVNALNAPTSALEAIATLAIFHAYPLMDFLPAISNGILVPNQLCQLCQQAKQRHHHTAAAYLAGLLQLFPDLNLTPEQLQPLQELTANSHLAPLCTTTRKPVWLTTLDAFEQSLAPKQNTAANDTDSDSRTKQAIVSWIVELAPISQSSFTYDLTGHIVEKRSRSNSKAPSDSLRKVIHIQPRLHTRNKKGTFSAGRNIALLKLRDGYYHEYLSPKEQNAAHFVSDDSHGLYPRLSTAAITCLPESPFVFIDDSRHDGTYQWDNPNRPAADADLDKPVKLVPDTNAIITVKSDSCITIMPKYGFRGNPRDAVGAYCDLADFPTVRYYYLTEKDPVANSFLKCGDPLGQLVIPRTGEEQLRALITRLAKQFTIAGDYADDAYSNLPAVQANICLHVIIAREDDDILSFDFRNQPLPDEQLLQPVGSGAASLPYTRASGENILLKRSLKAETKALRQLVSDCPALPQDTAKKAHCDLDDLEQSLLALDQLNANPNVILDWDKTSPIKVSSKLPTTALKLSASSAAEWFSLRGQLNVSENEIVSLQQLLDALDQRAGTFVRLSQTSYLQLTKDLIRKLEALKSAGTLAKDTITMSPAALPMLASVFSSGLPKQLQDQINRMKQAFEATLPIPKNLNGILRPYQQDGFRYLARLADCRIGCCLADDMGLGKTIQLLTLLLREAPNGPALVICPASICQNWLREANRFAPSLHAIVLPTSGRKELIDQAKANDLIISTYGILTSEAELFAAKPWHTVILDEAQAIKNHTAKRTQNTKSLKADIRIASTGTPIENHLLELWSLFDFLNPGLLGSATHFERTFVEPDGRPNPRLKKLVSPLIMRRCKADVLDDLPPKTEITLPVELPDAEMTFYETLRREALDSLHADRSSRITILAQLTKLRRCCCHPSLVNPKLKLQGAKLQRLIELILELKDAGQRALVFSQYVDFLALVKPLLSQNHITFQYLDGATTQKARMAAVDSFQQGDGDVFLISLKAGGTGLNLTAASYIILTDPWWNPAVEDQAADRAHRIGQTNPVTVYRLIATNTVEERVLALHDRKRKASNDILSGAESSEITEKELLALFDKP